MLWSSIGMSLACSVMGCIGLLYVRATDDGGYTVDNKAAGSAIAVSVFFFVFNFAYGFGPIVWVYCSEMFPLRYRARCVGVCTLANWAGNFIIAQFTPMLLESIQFSTFFVFGAFCLLGIFLSAWMPETKGVPLELIQQLFDHKSGFKSTAESKDKAKGKVADDTEEVSSSESSSEGSAV